MVKNHLLYLSVHFLMPRERGGEGGRVGEEGGNTPANEATH